MQCWVAGVVTASVVPDPNPDARGQRNPAQNAPDYGDPGPKTAVCKFCPGSKFQTHVLGFFAKHECKALLHNHVASVNVRNRSAVPSSLIYVPRGNTEIHVKFCRNKALHLQTLLHFGDEHINQWGWYLPFYFSDGTIKKFSFRDTHETLREYFARLSMALPGETLTHVVFDRRKLSDKDLDMTIQFTVTGDILSPPCVHDAEATSLTSGVIELALPPG